MTGLGDRLRNARLIADLSQEELASRIGMTRSAVAQWEAGELHPRPKTLARIAQTCGVDPLYLESGVSLSELTECIAGASQMLERCRLILAQIEKVRSS